jgi:Family of unknown function (DUF6286)
MTALRRVTQLLGIGVLFAVGTVLILSATDAIGPRWRIDAADAFRDLARPDLADWALALIGAAGVLLGVAMLISQLLPARRGSHRMHEVHHDADGTTRIRGRAVINTVRQTLEQLDGVTSADARWTGKVLRVEVRVDDDANLQTVETRVRDALGLPFWIDLGLADAEMNLVILHNARAGRDKKVR